MWHRFYCWEVHFIGCSPASSSFKSFYGPGFGLVNLALLTGIMTDEMKGQDDGVCQLNTLCLLLFSVMSRFCLSV